MIRRPPRSTRTTHSFPTRRSSDLYARAFFFTATAVGYQRQTLPAELHVVEIMAHQYAQPAYKQQRSEEHTSELQSLMRISYAVFCLTKKKITEYHKKRKHNKMQTTKAKHTKMTMNKKE